MKDENGEEKYFSTTEVSSEQREFASVRGTKKMIKSTLKGIEKFQAKNPGATKEQIQGFVKKNPQIKKGVETLSEINYKAVGGKKGAQKFMKSVGGKTGKFGQSLDQRMEQIEKNIPKPELSKTSSRLLAKPMGGTPKIAAKVLPKPVNYPSGIKKPISNVSLDSIKNQMKLRK